MRKRYLWFAISGAIVAIAIGALAVQGLNLGIDFKGGTQISFTTPQPTSLASVAHRDEQVRHRSRSSRAAAGASAATSTRASSCACRR